MNKETLLAEIENRETKARQGVADYNGRSMIRAESECLGAANAYFNIGEWIKENWLTPNERTNPNG